MGWIMLVIAGIFETIWAISMKYSEGFTRFWPSAMTAVAMVVSLYLLALSLRTLPLGTAYTIWTGIGALGTVIYGIAVFGESKGLLKLIFVTMIIGGIAGLKFVSGKESPGQKTEECKTIRTEAKPGNDTPGHP